MMKRRHYHMLAEFLFVALGVVGYTYDEETLDDFKRYILKSIIILSYQLIRFNNNETTLLLVSQRLGYPGYPSKLLSQITIVSRMK